MTTVDPRTPTTTVLIGTALLVLPAIALPLEASRLTMVGAPTPWLFALIAPAVVLAALSAIWWWPDKGWRWVLLGESLCALSVGLLSGTADRAVTALIASLVGTTALLGVLGAAGWLARSGARALAAAVAGLAVVSHTLRYVLGAVEYGRPVADLTPLFAMAAATVLCASALLALGARFRSEHARLSRRVVIAAAAAALIPVAFATMSSMAPPPIDDFAALATRLRETGIVALVAVVAVVALTAWAGPRLALGALSLGALVAGAGTVVFYVLFFSISGDEPTHGLGPTSWLLILTGLAVGVAIALLPIRGYLGAGAALLGAAALYLADAADPRDQVWQQLVVAVVVAAVIAGGAAVCDGPSAVAVGVIGVMLGGALGTVDWIWNARPTSPVYTEGVVDWMPIALMGGAAIGLAAFAYLGSRDQRLQTYQTSGLPTVP